jgi:WD40 repeat protein
MRFSYTIPAVLIGVSVFVQPVIVVTLASEQQFNDKARKLTVRIDLNKTPAGSGVILYKQVDSHKKVNIYYVLTAKHVVSQSGEYSLITYPDQKSHQIYPSSVTLLPDVDLAILQFESSADYSFATPIKVEDLKATDGARVWIVGYPKYTVGSPIPKDPPVIPGNIILPPGQSLDNNYDLAYNNPTARGMSGSPILNQRGELIGVHGRGGKEINPNNLESGPVQINYGTSIKLFNERAAKAFFELGMKNLEQKNYTRAREDFSLALRFNSNFADAYMGLSRAYFGMVNYAEASRNVSRAIDNYPKTANNPQLAEAYRLRGAIFVEQKNYREAEKNYQQAIQFNSNDANFVADVQRRIEALPKPQISNVPQPKPTTSPTTGTQPVATRLSSDWVFTTLPAQAKVFTVAFSPDGRFLASGTEDGKIQLWDLTAGKSSAINAHSKEVNAIVFSPDGTKLASSASDGVKIWNLQQGSLSHFKNLANASLKVRSIAFSPNGQTIATGTAEGQIKLWQVNTGKELPGLSGHKGQVSVLTYSPDGRTIVSGGIDNTIKIWNLNQPNSRRALTLTGHQDLILSIIFSRDGQTLITSSRDRTIRMWNFNTRQLQRPPLSVDGLILNFYVAISPDGNILASGNNSNIKIWNLSNNQSQELAGHNHSVSSLVFSSDGKLASGSQDGTIRIWQKK